jgi:hypothetical protein
MGRVSFPASVRTLPRGTKCALAPSPTPWSELDHRRWALPGEAARRDRVARGVTRSGRARRDEIGSGARVGRGVTRSGRARGSGARVGRGVTRSGRARRDEIRSARRLRAGKRAGRRRFRDASPCGLERVTPRRAGPPEAAPAPRRSGRPEAARGRWSLWRREGRLPGRPARPPRPGAGRRWSGASYRVMGYRRDADRCAGRGRTRPAFPARVTTQRPAVRVLARGGAGDRRAPYGRLRPCLAQRRERCGRVDGLAHQLA